MQQHKHHSLLTHQSQPEVVLRNHGFRVTSTRVALLRLLELAGVPLSIQGVLERWGERVPDTATLYRSLTDLHAAGVVKRIELGTGSAHFEYTPARPHHHHIICNECGLIEELEHCTFSDSDIQRMYHPKQFISIYSHNLEFFGLCKKCAAQKT